MNRNFIGIDAHVASCTLQAVNGRGKMIMQATVPTHEARIVAQTRTVPPPVSVVVEAGKLSEWLHAILKPVVDEVVICDPRKNKLLAAGSKSDKIDAGKLAELLRGGFVRPVYAPPAAMSELRSAVRLYSQAVKSVAQAKNRLKAFYQSRGVRPPKTLYCPEALQANLKLLKPGGDRFCARETAQMIVEAEQRRQRVHQRMLDYARRQKAYALLLSAPGIGPIGAARLLAKVVTPHRFATKSNFWNYCGLAVVVFTSGDWQDGVTGLRKRKRTRTRGLNRNHCPELKSVFMTAAQSSLRGAYRQFYERKVAEGMDPAVAKVTVARSIASATLAIWKKGEKFEVARLHKP